MSSLAAELGQLGFVVRQRTGLLVFGYDVPLGSHRSERLQLGLADPPDWPLTPPPGPHVSPPLHHPDGAVHGSPLGPDWVYWSRPFPGWHQSPRTAAAYMAHVRRLFSQT